MLKRSVGDLQRESAAADRRTDMVSEQLLASEAACKSLEKALREALQREASSAASAGECSSSPAPPGTVYTTVHTEQCVGAPGC